MNSLLPLFFDNLFPILLIALIGFFAGQWLNIKTHDISKITLYVLSPALVFDLLSSSHLSNSEIINLFIFTSLGMLLTGAIALMIGWMLHLPRDVLAAVVLTAGLINAGNYGLSLNKFAFGDLSLPAASIVFVTSVIIINTFGVAVASLGTHSLKDSLVSLLKIPSVYAVFLALLFLAFDWKLPTPIERITSSLSDATIPMMLLLLGLQMRSHKGFQHMKALLLTVSVRLLASPIVAFLLVAMLNIQGFGYKAGMVQASMPTAVMAIVLATEFDTQPEFVTSAVLVSTLVSPLTLTPLLSFLGV